MRNFILDQPFTAVAAIIDRPGYFDRYREKHDGQLWHLDKTAFCILVERAAKFADLNNRHLEIVYERCGRREDRRLEEYLKNLKRNGAPFDSGNMKGYSPLRSDDYRRIVLGDARRKKKELPQLQLSDLVLYPIGHEVP